VRLQSERPLIDLACEVFSGLLVGWFVVINDGLVVDLDLHVLALHDDRFGVPHVVIDVLLGDGLDRIQAAGLLRILFVRIVDLSFESVLRPAFRLELGMEINTTIAVRFGS
jgi:hypothetical protein